MNSKQIYQIDVLIHYGISIEFIYQTITEKCHIIVFDSRKRIFVDYSKMLMISKMHNHLFMR